MANCEWIDVDGSPVRVQRRSNDTPVDVDEVQRIVREIRAQATDLGAEGVAND